MAPAVSADVDGRPAVVRRRVDVPNISPTMDRATRHETLPRSGLLTYA
jgi:hypothetical protein